AWVRPGVAPGDAARGVLVDHGVSVGAVSTGARTAMQHEVGSLRAPCGATSARRRTRPRSPVTTRPTPRAATTPAFTARPTIDIEGALALPLDRGHPSRRRA